MHILIVLISFIFGIIVGSFLNVVILRLPEEQTLGGRSHCMSCGHMLGFWQLVPVFSYMFLGGRCYWCKNKISPRYIIVEFISGLLFALIAYTGDYNSIAGLAFIVALWIASAALLTVFIIDLEHFLIFDNVLVIASILFLVCSGLSFYISGGTRSLLVHGSSMLFGALLGPVPFFLVWWFSKGKWMGFGDVKLMAFIGMLVGPKLVFVAMFLAIISGGFFSVFLLMFTKKTLKSQIPFGCFLAPASFVTLLYGPFLLHWYLGVLGF